jgi:2-polyprenyl-6-methoxyphenol hydroxylase-like FAD-dependent oxidoreductase
LISWFLIRYHQIREEKKVSTHFSVTMSIPDKKISIAICGGGISGLSLAIGLLRYPHLSVHIYESASAFSEIGAGISFGPNAMRAMSLINPSILRGYDRHRTENGSKEKKDSWFDFRWGMDTRSGKAGEWFHSTIAKATGQSSIHRVSLNRVYDWHWSCTGGSVCLIFKSFPRENGALCWA